MGLESALAASVVRLVLWSLAVLVFLTRVGGFKFQIQVKFDSLDKKSQQPQAKAYPGVNRRGAGPAFPR